MPEFGDSIDAATFDQILEMDDDEDEREFSKSIVYDFFQQADTTFQKMDANLYVPAQLSIHFRPYSQLPDVYTKLSCTDPRRREKRDLDQLSALGHFLKGSSATLGLTKVKDSCEKIQHFGAHKDETGTRDEPNDDTCLANCKTTIQQAKEEFREVERMLRRFYHEE